jgi:hypothetical protein
VVDEDGFERTAQSAESAGGGLTTRLQVQVLLGEPDLSEAGFAGLFFLGGGVPGIFSGPDFSGIRNLPFCDIAEPAAINSAMAENRLPTYRRVSCARARKTVPESLTK